MFKFSIQKSIIKFDVFRHFCSKVAKSHVSESIVERKSYGQPTPYTHPHLLKLGEITPMIQRSEYNTRRELLMESIAKHTAERNKDLRKHLIIIPSASKQYMSDKIPYFFRQNTDFLYLTGCLEPDSCLILAATDTPSKNCVSLFMREKDKHSELWDGPRTGPDEAVELFGVDQALPMSELQNYLQMYMKSNPNSTLWFDYVYVCRYDYMSPVQTSVHKVMCDYLNEIINKMWESPKPFIHKQRLIKSPAEIALMKKSCEISSDAIKKTISTSKPGINEYQIFAQVDYECRMNGAEYLAYPPVVAGGKRANIIHYIDNNHQVISGEMVLMDVGCEYHGYSADITRTWPINGKFTPEQKALYEAVLSVQKELINLCADFPTLDNLYDSMCILLGKKLQEIGLVSRNASAQDIYKTAYNFCPHHVSHYLGMDVHDTSLIPRNIKVQPGMIITIEPGIYINETHKDIPKEFQGLGIRIEDDILITEDGPVVLTETCPSSLNEIEELASENQ